MLEKTFKIIKSYCKPNTAKYTNIPCPQVPHLRIFQLPSGMVTQPLPWAACFNA